MMTSPPKKRATIANAVSIFGTDGPHIPPYSGYFIGVAIYDLKQVG